MPDQSRWHCYQVKVERTSRMDFAHHDESGDHTRSELLPSDR